RGSLFITPSTSMSSINSSSPLSRLSPSPPQNERLVSHLGAPPSKHRQVHNMSDTPNGSPGHSRVFSENSIPSKMRTGPFPSRSSSAAAQYKGRSGLDAKRR